MKKQCLMYLSVLCISLAQANPAMLMTNQSNMINSVEKAIPTNLPNQDEKSVLQTSKITIFPVKPEDASIVWNYTLTPDDLKNRYTVKVKVYQKPDEKLIATYDVNATTNDAISLMDGKEYPYVDSMTLSHSENEENTKKTMSVFKEGFSLAFALRPVKKTIQIDVVTGFIDLKEFKNVGLNKNQEIQTPVYHTDFTVLHDMTVDKTMTILNDSYHYVTMSIEKQ